MTRGHARNLMTSPVVTVTADTTLNVIADMFAMQQIRGVPVVDAHEHVIGFVSDTDIMAALLQKRGQDTLAATLMSAPAFVVDEFDTVDDVMRVLTENKIHHVPVVRGRKAVGIISPADVIRFLATELPIPPEAG